MISVKNLHKSFLVKGTEHVVLSGVSIDIPDGSFTTVFGPNGCGKSTFARIIAGLESFNSGVITGAAELRGAIGYVFQDYRRSLLPWASVAENILFPLTIRHMPRKAAQKKLEDLLALTSITLNLRQSVYSLSGGQAQMVCILRALIIEPKLLILDEPFAALDYEVSHSLRDKLAEISAKLKLTVIFISHDIEEAIALGDRVVFLTRPPTTVRQVLSVPLVRPRPSDIETLPEFHTLKVEALKIFTGTTIK